MKQAAKGESTVGINMKSCFVPIGVRRNFLDCPNSRMAVNLSKKAGPVRDTGRDDDGLQMMVTSIKLMRMRIYEDDV